MQRARKTHRHEFVNPDGEKEVLILRIPSWVETAKIRARLEYFRNEYVNTEMHKQWMAGLEAVKKGEEPDTIKVPQGEYETAIAWQECSLEETVGFVDGVDGSDMSTEEVREALLEDLRYREVLRDVRDVIFFQRGLYGTPNGTPADGGASEVAQGTGEPTGEGATI